LPACNACMVAGTLVARIPGAERLNIASLRLPLWIRLVLIAGVAIFASGTALFAYRYYNHPVTLTVAVGSIDGEAARVMSAIASMLVSINAPVRLTVIDTGTALAAGKMFASGKVDLAVVRGDVGDLSQEQAVVVVSHLVAIVIAPPGSAIDAFDKLKGHGIGVIGEEANSKLVDVLSKEYGLDRAKTFKDVALADARQAIQSKQISALLVVIPLSQKYLSQVRGFFRQDPKAMPVLIAIESAAAIADVERAYESFDVPKGTLRGAPPVPHDDLTTLRTSLYLIAKKKLGSDLVTSLTQAIMTVRRDLMIEQPIFAQIAAPSTDADAYLAVHPGAAAFYNGTQQSFMDEYGNWIYLAPMRLGGIATIFAAVWKFLGIGPTASEAPLDKLYALAPRIRKADSLAELGTIEDEIDDILRAQATKAATGDKSAIDAVTLNVAAHRLEGLVHDRRECLQIREQVVSSV
jgi:TRAP-type uncharacterized transport system substrate-binding protein